jgi:glucose-1-phosphate thymidylyltransferase
MRVLILAAGYGTRLYAITKTTPKALLDINGNPLIYYILEKLVGVKGVSGVTVVTNNKFFEQFKEWAQGLKNFPLPVDVVNDGTLTPEDRLGSIGDIDFVIRHKKLDEDLLVVGGDNLFDESIDDLVQFARQKSPGVTIGVYDIHTVAEATKFGVVALDREHKVVSFEEKPDSPKSSLISMCVYFFPKQTLSLVGQYLKEFKRGDKAGEYIQWLKERHHVYGFQFLGKWYDIGSVESYQEAQKKFRPKK